MSNSEPNFFNQWYHFQTDLIWPDGTFKSRETTGRSQIPPCWRLGVEGVKATENIGRVGVRQKIQSSQKDHLNSHFIAFRSAEVKLER